MQTKTVLAIVEDYLKCNGFDGLVAGDRECACILADLAPCGDVGDDCEAGWLAADPGDSEFVVTVDESERA